MDLKTFTLEQLQERLGKRSNRELYKMAKGYGIELPSGLDDQAVILTAIHEALQGSGKPPAAGGPDAPSSSDPAAGGPRIRVVSMTGAARWRSGQQWGVKWREVPVAMFTALELEALRADEYLRVKDV